MTRVPRLHAITDDARLAQPRFVDDAVAVLEAGGSELALHLRGRATTAARLHELVGALLPASRASGATLLVNDRIDVALVGDADGVQLREDSIGVAHTRALLGSNALVGVSRHAVSIGADDGDADFVLFGAIYETGSHPGRQSAGLPALVEASGVGRQEPRHAPPLIAIGGITPERVAEVRAAGAYGVAAIRGVWSGGAAAVAEYVGALNEAGAKIGGGAGVM